jgi:hypothetical protein
VNVFDCNLLLLISYEILGQMSHLWTIAMGMFSTIYLSMDIYPCYFIFVQTIHESQGKKISLCCYIGILHLGCCKKIAFTLVQIHFGYGTERSFWTSS